MPFNRYFTAIKNSKLVNQLTNAKSFKELSHNLHFVVISVLLVQNILVTIFRFNNYPIIFILVNVCEISLYGLSIIIFKKKYYDASILLTAFCLPIIFSYVLHIPKVKFLTCLWFLLGFQIIYTILINGNRKRIGYFIFCALIFHIPGIESELSFPANLIKYVQISTLSMISIILAAFFEKQDDKLINLNKKLTSQYLTTEAQRQQLNNKNAELVVFTHIMSHDLKAPLQTIKAFSGLLETEYKKNAFIDKSKIEYFKFISNSVDAMAELIQSLLTYSKIEQKKYTLKTVDLQEVIQQVLLVFLIEIKNKHIIIERQDLPTVNGDMSIIKTVFQNLISNAIKFQPKLKASHQPKLLIWSDETNLHKHIFFKDNGIGIKPENIADLFTPFEKFHAAAEYKGSGLGMSICKKIMHIHNGRIELINSNKQGSTFKLTFPK